MKRLCSVLCVAALLLGLSAVGVQGKGEQEELLLTVTAEPEGETVRELSTYFAYKNDVSKKTVSPAQTLVLSANQASSAAKPGMVDGKECLLLAEVDAEATWTVALSQPVIFTLTLEYQLYGDQTANTSVGVYVDGQLPYAEANQLELESVWYNEGFTINSDEKGDHIRPTQVRHEGWHAMTLKDMYGDAVQIYLDAGEHTLAIRNEDYGVYLHSLTLAAPVTVPAYESYVMGATDGGEDYFQLYEGELAQYKSDSMLYPIYDRSSPVTQPYSIENVLLNTIGGSNWSKSGQWIDWEIEVPEDGWYTLGMRVRQNTARGLYAYRNFYVDGQQLFAEMKEYAFTYDSGWQLLELGGDDPWRVYLTAGPHTIRMEATCGPMEYTHGVLSGCLSQLNDLYRQIIMITGTTPDALRDYSLHQEIPGLTNTLLNLAKSDRSHVVL